jgi:uroporphyrinogen-III decarboxylase
MDTLDALIALTEQVQPAATTVREQEAYRQGVADGKSLAEATKQPKPASIEEIMMQADNYANAKSTLRISLSTEHRESLLRAITQQAEALAQALDEADDWHHANNMRKKAEAERDQLRAQLTALQYDGELPPSQHNAERMPLTVQQIHKCAQKSGALMRGVSVEDAIDIARAIEAEITKGQQ